MMIVIDKEVWSIAPYMTWEEPKIISAIARMNLLVMPRARQEELHITNDKNEGELLMMILT